jgi:hypothetical protein
MNNMLSFLKKQRPPSVLGLALSGNQLEATVVRRLNGSLRVQQNVIAELALSPLSGDPELVGREIRNHLDRAGIRERRCALSIPPGWVLTVQVKLPDLPEADIASFLEIEAERGFPSGSENLYIANSRYRLATGEQYATLLGVPRNHLETLEKVLKAAQLKPVTFSVGIAAMDLREKASPDGTAVLALGQQSLDLMVAIGGGIAVLRSLDGAMQNEGAQRSIDAELVAREMRITLGQLPAALAEKTRVVRLFGRGDAVRRFAADISPRAQAMGLNVQLMERASAAQFDPPISAEVASSPALALAANWLKAGPAVPELLPPKVTAWQQLLSGKQTSKKLAWAGGLAGAVVVCVLGAFIYQSWQIARLESRWGKMQQKVTELQTDQDQTKKYGPWFDRSYRGLRILRRLTEAFPEDGHVSAKNLEIRDLATITCSGVAKDNQSYIALIDKLQTAPEVSGLKTENVRGQSPLTFTFNFQWEGGVPNGN